MTRKRTHSGSAQQFAPARADMDHALYTRIERLADNARDNAPYPRYLESFRKNSLAGSTPVLTERQREKVVKYINELAEDFELSVQTGGLACNYFDRYMASIAGEPPAPSEGKRNIQMIASTCLLIAAKFSDRKLPPLSELEKVHHGQCRAEDFAALELRILDRLQWKLLVPLPHAFIDHLRELCVDAPFTSSIEDRMLFFIDLSVYGYHFLAYSPCAVAAAAIITAWKFSDEHDAVPKHIATLARACQLEPAHLSGCVNALARYYQNCFPDAAKGSNPSLFIPIDKEADSRTTSPVCPSPEMAEQVAKSGGGASPGPGGRRDGPETPEVLAYPPGGASQPQQGGQAAGAQQQRQQQGDAASSAADAACASADDVVAVSRAPSVPCMMSREGSLVQGLGGLGVKEGVDLPGDQAAREPTPVSVIESNSLFTAY